MFKCSHVHILISSISSIISFGINWIYNQGLSPTTIGCISVWILSRIYECSECRGKSRRLD